MAHNAFANLLAEVATQSKQTFTASTSQIKPASIAGRHDDFLALQSSLLLCYNAHLAAIASHRALGLSLSDSNGAEMVQNLVRLRLHLEKMKPIEARMRPRWARWIKAAQVAKNDANGDEQDEEVTFRPNPGALLDTTPAPVESKASRSSRSSRQAESSSSVYRPPKMAAVPYNPRDDRYGLNDKEARARSAQNTHLLSDLSTSLSSNPYSEATSGLATGSRGSNTNVSARARKLAEMKAYEEDNFTRLAQSKKDARQRRRDEEDVALGGATTAGVGRGGKVGAGLEEEFGDLLRGHGKKRGRGELDDLRGRSKAARGTGGEKGGHRSSGGGTGGNRFQKAVKSHHKRK
ncbi:hypothetical protein BDZ90DRAFT_260425 [Jaminaea rosea]|uniref:Sas10 C-terminal domain-containing protein n=1 Tax=Jaminaea rosea TaxID=1569628 RepID=A0A316UPV0_9BASI|nr:hypothetical protein BDZ90DRAFT_260425 [Jaminaea rosea]PWN27332.1 hypothetical protein BDZ90DRAFT_260425 [Jaminaea rosea]